MGAQTCGQIRSDSQARTAHGYGSYCEELRPLTARSCLNRLSTQVAHHTLVHHPQSAAVNMGRLPKGFKKTMQPKGQGQEEEEENAPAAPASKAPAPSKKSEDAGPNPAFLKDTAADSSKSAAGNSNSAKPQRKPVSEAAGSSDDDAGSDGAAGSGPETRGHMIQRHKREMQAFKKNLPRLGKKSKDEVAKLTAELEAKHAKELADFDAASITPAAETTQASAAAAATMAKLQVHDDDDDDHEGAAGGGKMTKAMKRRQKQAAAEAERAARIAAEAAEAGPSARAQEEEALVALLKPLGLRMREIRADGHCLYRSLEDQLTLVSANGGNGNHAPAMDYQQLREAAAAHIRKHPDQYIHYIDTKDGETAEQAVERYCDELANTAAWGGQLELSVLAQVLQRPIKVLTVGMNELTLGDEHAGKAEPLQVCYLRHAFGLGEHYNSLEPAKDS